MAVLDKTGSDTGSDRHEKSDIEFRTLTHKQKRRAFKLERMFWKILEGAAAADRKSLAEFVAGVLAEREKHPNKTSLLRVAAAQWLIDKVVDVSNRSMSQKMLGQIVKASPMPCFLVSGEHAIESPNGAFMKMLDSMQAERGQPTGGAISIRFRSDVPSLTKRCKTSAAGFVTDELILSIGGEARILNAQITALESAGGRPMGFLIYIVHYDKR